MDNMMYKKQKNRGFTLAETLLTVAIIVILAAVAFIFVPNYLRSMTQLERDGIAKEIFIASQNHLTMAESQGYLGKSGGYGEAEDAGKGIYYFVVKGSASFGDANSAVLNQMLPFASVDETVRLGGYYLVRYQKSPARVLDVFYSDPNGRFPYKFEKDPALELSAMLGIKDADNTDNKGKRRNYGGSVIGWYGGEEALNLTVGATLKAPEIEIINEEKLQVKVTDTNSTVTNASLTLILTGAASGKQAAIPIRPSTTGPIEGTNTYLITLDDITTEGNHFTELFPDFIPGENITVQAVAFNNTVLSNIEYSAPKTTNSLFADIDAAGTTASIANIRHLENLDAAVSNLDKNDTNYLLNITKATQINDLSWSTFKTNTNGDTTQVYNKNHSNYTGEGSYYPVCPADGFSYDGQSHTVSDIVFDNAAANASLPAGTNAGLFGVLKGTAQDQCAAIENLRLMDCSIAADGAGGALAGELEYVNVTNVLAIHRDGQEAKAISAAGNVGGLIGQMTGGSVQASAAALIVSSTGGNAGGLVGNANGTSFTSSYSGGHTSGGAYSDTQYNVTSATGSAGGLIGNGAGVSAVFCYSTCSVSGTTAGGFAGALTVPSGNTVSNCYSTGLVSVSGTTRGAFAGTLSGTATDCRYYDIINESQDTDSGFVYLSPLSHALPAGCSITPLDATVTTYDGFVGAGSAWAPSDAYDSSLDTYYKNTFNLRTVGQLETENKTGPVAHSVANVPDGGFVLTHYGDWPAPEIFFINTPAAP